MLFRRAVTPLSNTGLDEFLVSREGDNHYLVRMQHDTNVKIDGEPMVADEMH